MTIKRKLKMVLVSQAVFAMVQHCTRCIEYNVLLSCNIMNRWQVTCWMQHSAVVVLLTFELTQLVNTHDNAPVTV